MSGGAAAKWDERYRDARAPGDPARVLTENAHLLPAAGRCLEIACGLGANALFLARRGLTVDAWDLSPVAVDKLRQWGGGLPLTATVRDVLAQPPAAACFDVIVVSRFLERTLTPALIAALNPGGLLFYQTFTRTDPTGNGPGNPAFRLEDNELLGLFAPLKLRAYREESLLGDLLRGLRGEAWLVGER